MSNSTISNSDMEIAEVNDQWFETQDEVKEDSRNAEDLVDPPISS